MSRMMTEANILLLADYYKSLRSLKRAEMLLIRKGVEFYAKLPLGSNMERIAILTDGSIHIAGGGLNESYHTGMGNDVAASVFLQFVRSAIRGVEGRIAQYGGEVPRD